MRANLSAFDRRLRSIEQRNQAADMESSPSDDEAIRVIFHAIGGLKGAHELIGRLDSREENEQDKYMLSKLPDWRGSPAIDVIRTLIEIDNAV